MASTNAEDEFDGVGDLFHQEDTQEVPKPFAYDSHKLSSGEVVTLRLVSEDPLWGHMLWNAGRVMADYLTDHADELVKDRCVLELGAGAGLPSFVAAMKGAKSVVVTDYPYGDAVGNLAWNIENCSLLPKPRNIIAKGHLWGFDAHDILLLLPEEDKSGFHTVILADIIYSNSEQSRLVDSVKQTLRREPLAYALVFFTPYRPWNLHKDLQFFPLAESNGFKVEKLFEKKMDRVMFENDPGDEELRKTVFGYKLTWNIEALA